MLPCSKLQNLLKKFPVCLGSVYLANFKAYKPSSYFLPTGIMMFSIEGYQAALVTIFFIFVLVFWFSDFEEASRNTFQQELEDLGLGAGPFTFSYHEAASLMDTSAFHSPVSFSYSISPWNCPKITQNKEHRNKWKDKND